MKPVRHTMLAHSIFALLVSAGYALGASTSSGINPDAPIPVVSADAPVLNARTSLGFRAYRVTDPEAFESAAALLPDDPKLKQGEQQGHRLYARVIVEIADPASAARIDAIATAQGLQTKAQQFSSLPGPISRFYTVETPSIRIAAALVASLVIDPAITSAMLDTQRPRALRNLPIDPGVSQQWYLSNPTTPSASLNVIPAWKAGFIGSGVTVGIVEAGFLPDHPDYVNNYNAAASQSPLFTPGYTNHGTSCAGLIAMSANNGIGGAGVAYGAKVARQYYGSESQTAAALLYQPDLNHIRSNSWGPPDSGSLGPISPIEDAALESGAMSGRSGKGTVYVWAGGNGGDLHDRVDYDQYASHHSVMAIGSIDNTDALASYSELGSSLMFVTTSSADFAGSNGSGIYTTSGVSTTPPGNYASAFGGTSAAAPIASGVIALVLQARPDLTWRDIQHVLVRTARRVDPTDDGWLVNGAGRWVNERYGFGALDAGAAVALAQTFPLKGPPIALTSPEKAVDLPIPDNTPTGVSSTIHIPSNFLVEKAQVVLTAPHSRLGDLRIELVSPAGTPSLLASTRTDFSSGYSNYTFTTVRAWDERAKGDWTLTISDRTADISGMFNRWSLKLYGGAAPCPGDWNTDGHVNIDDIFIFLNDWFSTGADADNNGIVSLDDVFIFINQWFASSGCTP
jgi:subtilisin-like proprotein convertase family protein